ncbi:MAG: ribonuclease HII [Lentisphaeria bacterium]
MTTAILNFEKEAHNSGYSAVAGVDEVGRGPLAGPVVAAAVILPNHIELPPVTDSKALSAVRRDELFSEIKGLPGIVIGIGKVEPVEIDRINILQATYRAMRLALNNLAQPADFALVDGNPVPDLPVPSKSIVRGDSRSASIAAASIIAKVIRDRAMTDYDKVYNGYSFSDHKGYGTRQHLAALKKLGPCAIHRRSFAPVAHIVNGGLYQPELKFDG